MSSVRPPVAFDRVVPDGRRARVRPRAVLSDHLSLLQLRGARAPRRCRRRLPDAARCRRGGGRGALRRRPAHPVPRGWHAVVPARRGARAALRHRARGDSAGRPRRSRSRSIRRRSRPIGCRRWVDLGITRFSVGVESTDDAVLARLGRSHDARVGVASGRGRTRRRASTCRWT